MPAKRVQTGIALVTAMLIVAIAVVIAAQVAFANQLWFRQMENVQDRGATDWLRRGALHWASVALIDDAARNRIDHLGEAWAQGLPTLPVEGGSIRASVVDAQSRFNLNSIGGGDAASAANLRMLQRLLESLRIDPQLALALVDWIDRDSDVSAGGAEDIDYLNLDPPYRAANRPLASVEELRLVRGFDAKIFAALLPHVTVLPVVTNIINVNTASPEVLAALVPGLDLSSARVIAEGRDGNPMSSPQEFQKRLPQGIPAPTTGVSFSSDYFLVTLETSIGRHLRRGEALLARVNGGRSTKLYWERPQVLLEPADE